MSLIARLRAYAADAFGIASHPDIAEEADERLAAIALLVHVARADGVLAPVEAERLARLVEGRYAQTPAEAEALLARAAAYDAQTRDMAALVERMGHDSDAAGRARLLAMAWSVAAADGVVHEFEEALVWRLGRLLGFDDAAIGLARAGRAERRSPSRDPALAMIVSLTLILAAQLLGEALARALSLPVPGPVIGMAVLLAFFVIRDRSPDLSRRILPPPLVDGRLEGTGKTLLANLSLMFVPAGAGIVGRLDVLAAQGASLAIVVLVSTLVTLAATAFTFVAVSRWLKPGERP